MAKLINGNGNPAVYAGEDADLIAALAGSTSAIAAVGNEFAATTSGANTIILADGVLVTKEGRRIQLDAGLTDSFDIPTGVVGETNYYIIGYHLYENEGGQQICETFVQLMEDGTSTIPEDTFRGGADDVYVSLYRVEQDGVNLGTITALLPKLSNLGGLGGLQFRNNNGDIEVSTDGGITWTKMGGGGMYSNAKFIIGNSGYGTMVGTNCQITITDFENETSSIKLSGDGVAALQAVIPSEYATVTGSDIYGLVVKVNKDCKYYRSALLIPEFVPAGTSISNGYNRSNGLGIIVFED